MLGNAASSISGSALAALCGADAGWMVLTAKSPHARTASSRVASPGQLRVSCPSTTSGMVGVYSG
jgi:hypothetical protein